MRQDSAATAGHTAAVYRHEVKFHIGRQDALLLAHMLRQCMQTDPNAGADGLYWIRSLYFDSRDNRDYTEKISGCADRKKLRLRLYDTAASAVKLELKNKAGSHVFKESLTLAREDARGLLGGAGVPLLGYDSAVARKVYARMQAERLRPVLLIDYDRQAFTLPFENIRITIDRDIRACPDPRKLFDRSAPTVPVFPDGRYVLEVKYRTMLPGFLRGMLTAVSPEPASVSKYCLSRQAISV